MATTSVSPLSAGTQQLYNDGLLPSNLPNSVLNGSSAGQLSQLAQNTSSLNQVNTLLGLNSTSDTASLSSTATDALTQAVNSQLTSSLNAAVHKFLPDSTATTQTNGSTVNEVG